MSETITFLMRNREEVILKNLADLNVLSKDLHRLIIEYEKTELWLESKINRCWKLATDQKYLYISQSNCIGRYTADNLQLVDKFAIQRFPYAMDISGNELYVYDEKIGIKVFDLNSKVLLRQWKTFSVTFGIKIRPGIRYRPHTGVPDNGILYYVGIDGTINVYTLNGSLIGTHRGLGLYHPHGIDIDNEYAYIADYGNNQVKVFHLLNWEESHRWGNEGSLNGNFISPNEIRLYGELCYVGDKSRIQVFTKKGDLLYRFGMPNEGSGYDEFNGIGGILMFNSRLFISDYFNQRVIVLDDY